MWRKFYFGLLLWGLVLVSSSATCYSNNTRKDYLGFKRKFSLQSSIIGLRGASIFYPGLDLFKAYFGLEDSYLFQLNNSCNWSHLDTENNGSNMQVFSWPRLVDFRLHFRWKYLNDYVKIERKHTLETFARVLSNFLQKPSCKPFLIDEIYRVSI